MRYRKLGNTDLSVSVVALGTWGFSGDWGGAVDDENNIGTVRAAVEEGINLIDTAPAYGNGYSETLLGKALSGIREKVILATKCGVFRAPGDVPGKSTRDWSPDSLKWQIEQSLNRLKTDYIDLYQVHWPNEKSPLSEAFTQLYRFQQEGLVGHVGVSNFTVGQIKEAMEYCPIASMQPPYSLLQRGIEEDILPFCKAQGIGIISYGSIGGGALTGKFTERPIFAEDDRRGVFYKHYREENWPKTQELVEALREVAHRHDAPVVQVAINWGLAQAGVTSTLVGARTPKQARMNAAAGRWELTTEDCAFIQKAYERIFG